MTKTRYTMTTKQAYCFGANITRRVWKDDDGRYFVKDDGKIRDVTHAKDWFYVANISDFRYAD